MSYGATGGDDQQLVTPTAIVAAATDFVRRPGDDAMRLIREASAVRLFWFDMKLRPHATAHRAVLLSGIFIFLTAIASLFVMEFDRYEHDRQVLHYVILERGVSAVAQLVFTTRGICVENDTLLVIANLNGLGLVVRAAIKVMMYDIPNYTLLGLLVVGLTVHLIASIVAWRGGLERFAIFMIGSEHHVLRMYRDYRLFNALSLLDLVSSILAAASVAFFTDVRWYTVVLFGVVVFISVALLSLMRVLIRKESKRVIVLVSPLYLLLPVLVCVALAVENFIQLDIHQSTRPLAGYSIASFLVARLALLVSAGRCMYHFGKGMRDAFASERDAVEFVRGEAETSYVDFFAQADDDGGSEEEVAYGAAAERRKEAAAGRYDQLGPS